jgi:hypothetical protein
MIKNKEVMKKLALLVIGLIVGTAFLTSCTKTCHCKVYVADEVKMENERSLEKSVYNKCSDIGFITIDQGKKYGEACE